MNGSIATLQPGGVWRGVDVAYDPVNDIYLVVTAYGAVRGIFTNSLGIPITEAFTIHAGSFGHFPNAEYSPHVSNGNGGSGGFLVVWNDDVHGNSVRGRVVAVHAPGRLVSGVQLLSEPTQGRPHFENRPVLAYSKFSHRFLVVWTTIVPSFGLQGRLVATNGAPVSAVMRFEEGASRDPAVAWNPATDEFGLGNSGWGGGGAFASFRRVAPGSGVVSPRSTFGFSGGTYATGLDVNQFNQYVFAWGLHPGTSTALFDPWGNLIMTSYVSNRIGGDLSMGLSFNPTTGTLIVVSSDWWSNDVAGAELISNGAPLTPAVPLTTESRASYYPLPAARLGTNQWNVVYSPAYLGAMNQIVASNGLGAGAPAPPPPTGGGSSSGCSTPDPFVNIGGGRCVNGGWLPNGGAPAPPPPPPPAPAPTAGCTTPDPFGPIGGGVCVNGGWLPSSSPLAPPPPPPPPALSTCGSASPGPGWVCVNGGWLPPGHPSAVSAPAPAPAPSPSSGGCSIPDPFVSLGGGMCVNGGWVPNTCPTSDPFVALGGGVCINGGWVPRGM